MMRRLPLIPTLFVLAAVAIMIGLGVWQIGRAEEKDAMQARYEANIAAAPVSLPNMPLGDALLFRRASGFCLDPRSITLQGAGADGFRAIARCRAGAEGPGFAVQLGSTHDPRAQIRWDGGPVAGYLAHEPDTRAFWSRWTDRRPSKLMIVAAKPVAGLDPNPPPDPSSLTNSSWSYAMQWFLFAGVALLIYGLAVRSRLGKETA